MHSIGKVVFVTYEKLIFEVSDFNKLNFNYDGHTYIAKGVIDYVTIVDDNNKKYIYQVIKVEDKEQMLLKDENSKVEYIGRFECIPVGIIKPNGIEFNMESYPFLQNKVYLTSKEEFNTMFQLKQSDYALNLGLIENKYSATVEMLKLFNHHTAVLGNTGSGKSTTIRQILSEIKKYNTNNLYFHIFDIHDEYGKEDDKAKKIDVIDNYKINLEDLDLQDWINLIKPSDLVQLPILQTALKLAFIIKRSMISEKWIKCFLAYTLYNNVQTDVVGKRTKIINVLHGTNIDTRKYSKFGNFDEGQESVFLNALTDCMKTEHYDEIEYTFLQQQMEIADYRSDSFDNLLKGLEYTFLLEESKGNSHVRGYCGTLETRIKSIQTRYSSLLVNKGNSNNVQTKQVNIYSVNELDDDLLLFFTTYLIKRIFEDNKKKELNSRDINIFVLEEAHRYISKSKENSSFQEIEFFKKIAREGRKFGCFLFLSSQRPSELSSTVLSQCNNYIIHRIKNNIDLDFMLKTIPYLDKNQLSRISYLPTGVAFLVGELFPIPIEVSINDSLKDNVSSTPIIKYENSIKETNIDLDHIEEFAY